MSKLGFVSVLDRLYIYSLPGASEQRSVAKPLTGQSPIIGVRASSDLGGGDLNLLPEKN